MSNPSSNKRGAVILLLIVLFFMEVARQPTLQAVIKGLKNGNFILPGGANPFAGINPGLVAYWFVGALALIALAGPAPDAAIGLLIILILLVLFSDIQLYTSLLQMPTNKK